MVIDVKNVMTEHGMALPGEHILCAFSGGVDSSVLLDILIKQRASLGIKVSAAHLNHMLRGDESERDEEFVRSVCESYGIELVCEQIDIGAAAVSRGESVELAARVIRYDFLRRAKAALGADKIAMAHNANDNLETVLFNLARGSGLDGMCGIPPVRGDIIRPLIQTTRRDIEKYASELGINYCEDRTNAETIYSRNKLRHVAVPALLEINPAAVENAARASAIMRRESEFLSELATRAADDMMCGRGTSINAFEFVGLNAAIRGRAAEHLARIALGDDTYTLEFRHVREIEALASNSAPSKSISLPRGLCVRREYELLVFEKTSSTAELFEIKLDCGEFLWGEYRVHVKNCKNGEKIHNSVNTFFVSYDKISSELFMRPRRIGDRIKLKKRPEKTLKKLFIDERVPAAYRGRIPVIADGDNVVAVYGFGIDERYAADGGERALRIEITKKAGAGI